MIRLNYKNVYLKAPDVIAGGGGQGGVEVRAPRVLDQLQVALPRRRRRERVPLPRTSYTFVCAVINTTKTYKLAVNFILAFVKAFTYEKNTKCTAVKG